MSNDYSELLKQLINAYTTSNFDQELTLLMEKTNLEKNELCDIISSLCGVSVNYDKNFIENIKNAIEFYHKNNKIVNKVKKCSMDCSDKEGKTPCMKSCPFNAIFQDKNTSNVIIDENKCTDCGMCVSACPSGGILDKVEFLPLVNALKGNSPIIAAVAPAIIGQFGENVSINKLRTAFKKIGFSDMIEVAFFADMLSMKEAVEFDHLVSKETDLMITSCCCPIWVAMIKRVYNDLITHVSPSVSPMIAAGKILKKLNPECKVVFVGPCIAKKAEAKERDIKEYIDFVLTFTELKDIFEVLDINPSDLEESLSSEYASLGGRLYGRTGGVSIAVSEALAYLFPQKHVLFKAVQVNGVKDCKEMLSNVQTGKIDANFIEGMGCIGGCSGGPKSIISKDECTRAINNFAEHSEIRIATESKCMLNILKKIDINSLDDFKTNKVEIFERKF
jgi:iron only hydrogenase large subunit-like protein